MIRKFETILLILFLFKLFVVQSSTSTNTENGNLIELAERFDRWQGKMEALEADNVELRAENAEMRAANSELQAGVKELKSQLEKMEKIIRPEQEETCNQQPKISSARKEKSIDNKKKGKTLSKKNATVLPLPTTCEDLRARGHFADGIYLLEDPFTKKIRAIPCEFPGAKMVNEGDSLGIIDLKTENVHFSVQRSTELTSNDMIVKFESAELNEGGYMDLTTGVFIVPVDGVYHFEFSGMNSGAVQIILQVNNADVAVTATDLSYLIQGQYYVGISLSTSLELKSGNTVNLYKKGDGTLYQYQSSVSNTHFSGWLVDEIKMP